MSDREAPTTSAPFLAHVVTAICLVVFIAVAGVVGTATIGNDWEAPEIHTPYEGNAPLYELNYELNHGENYVR